MAKMNNHDSSIERTVREGEQLLECPDTYLLILHANR